MIGALIGDLAAWTFDHDKDTFWKQLIPDGGRDAELSVYGHALMRAASKNVLDVPKQDVSFITESSEWTPKEWLRMSGQMIMWQLMCGWNDKKDYPEGMEDTYPFEKEDGYARMFVINLIRSLRAGKTKSETYHSEYSFEELSKVWGWRPQLNANGVDYEYSLLSHVFRAWDSFYRGFDFTSCIHNAMKWDGDRHLIACLTGAFADAMYGCEINYIKKKFADNDNFRHFFDLNEIAKQLEYPQELVEKMSDISFNNRTFYPKNCALTNVEIHQWENVNNPFDKVSFTNEEHDRILRSAKTHWDCRYGLYLDDGWIYVYRSHVLIGRFQIKAIQQQWYITNTQLSGEMPTNEFYAAIISAFYEGCRILNKLNI